MAKIRAYTTIEQSRKLAEILPLESADSYYSWHDEQYYIVNKDCPYPYSLKEKIPCWSLSALLNVLPKIHKLKPILDLEECSIQYSGIDLYVVASNPVDACYDMIIKLSGLKML